jgi:hypothetical protein
MKPQKVKTISEWERDIIKITQVISLEFPELSKYIKEIPENNSVEDSVNPESLEEYYKSLEEILTRYANTHKVSMTKKSIKNSLPSGYPLYPPSEDIYNQAKEERDLNPEDISKRKAPNESKGSMNEKSFEDDMSGNDLDVSGSELDDQQESVGSEDEENNYYSLGGDNHNDLDEDKA